MNTYRKFTINLFDWPKYNYYVLLLYSIQTDSELEAEYGTWGRSAPCERKVPEWSTLKIHCYTGKQAAANFDT